MLHSLFFLFDYSFATPLSRQCFYWSFAPYSITILCENAYDWQLISSRISANPPLGCYPSSTYPANRSSAGCTQQAEQSRTRLKQ